MFLGPRRSNHLVKQRNRRHSNVTLHVLDQFTNRRHFNTSYTWLHVRAAIQRVVDRTKQHFHAIQRVHSVQYTKLRLDVYRNNTKGYRLISKGRATNRAYRARFSAHVTLQRGKKHANRTQRGRVIHTSTRLYSRTSNIIGHVRNITRQTVTQHLAWIRIFTYSNHTFNSVPRHSRGELHNSNYTCTLRHNRCHRTDTRYNRRPVRTYITSSNFRQYNDQAVPISLRAHHTHNPSFQDHQYTRAQV